MYEFLFLIKSSSQLLYLSVYYQFLQRVVTVANTNRTLNFYLEDNAIDNTQQ